MTELWFINFPVCGTYNVVMQGVLSLNVSWLSGLWERAGAEASVYCTLPCASPVILCVSATVFFFVVNVPVYSDCPSEEYKNSMFRCTIQYIMGIIQIIKGWSKFLGILTKFLNVAISFVMSVRLSGHMVRLGCQWRDFHENWHTSIFWKSVKNLQVLLKPGKNRYYSDYQRLIQIFRHVNKISKCDH